MSFEAGGQTVAPEPATAGDGACAPAGAEIPADRQITAAELSTTRRRMPASLAEPDRVWGCPVRLSLHVISYYDGASRRHGERRELGRQPFGDPGPDARAL